jgi:hypothetical protein
LLLSVRAIYHQKCWEAARAEREKYCQANRRGVKPAVVLKISFFMLNFTVHCAFCFLAARKSNFSIHQRALT